jgi:hypothetical protein
VDGPNQGVGLRHHLHLDGRGLALPRVHAGSLLAQGRRLGRELVHDAALVVDA